MQQGWSDSDDDEASSYPPAPVPPHERGWRHPSELGPVDLGAVHGPSFSRGVAITAGVVGVAVAVGMFQLMSPGRGPVTAGSATSIVQPTATAPQPTSTLRASTTQGTVATELTPTTRAQPTAAPATSPPTTTEEPESSSAATAAPTTAAEASTTLAPSAPMPTVVVEGSGRPALLWGSGTYAIAAADGLATETITVIKVPSGVAYHAAVLVIDDGIAVLSINAPAPGTPMATAELPPTGDPVAVESAAGTELAPLELAPDGTRFVRAASTTPTGCAVRNASGLVVGVTSHSDGSTSRVVSAARIDELVRNAETIGSWIGVIGSSRSAAGALITDVAPSSPAATAGLLVDDLIVALDGDLVTSIDQFAAVLRTMRAGRTVTLEVVRGGERIGIVVTLADRATRTTSTTSVP